MIVVTIISSNMKNNFQFYESLCQLIYILLPDTLLRHLALNPQRFDQFPQSYRRHNFNSFFILGLIECLEGDQIIIKNEHLVISGFLNIAFEPDQS